MNFLQNKKACFARAHLSILFCFLFIWGCSLFMSEREQEVAEAERARLEKILSSPRGNNQVNKVVIPKAEEPTSPRKEVASPRKYFIY